MRDSPPGFAGADAYVMTMFAWAEPLFANIYIEIAERLPAPLSPVCDRGLSRDTPPTDPCAMAGYIR